LFSLLILWIERNEGRKPPSNPPPTPRKTRKKVASHSPPTRLALLVRLSARNLPLGKLLTPAVRGSSALRSSVVAVIGAGLASPPSLSAGVIRKASGAHSKAPPRQRLPTLPPYPSSCYIVFANLAVLPLPLDAFDGCCYRHTARFAPTSSGAPHRFQPFCLGNLVLLAQLLRGHAVARWCQLRHCGLAPHLCGAGLGGVAQQFYPAPDGAGCGLALSCGGAAFVFTSQKRIGRRHPRQVPAVPKIFNSFWLVAGFF